jgi:hypothetical protein
MKGLSCVLAASVVFASCGGTQPDEGVGAPAAQSYANLAQMMQAIPFPASNIIYDSSAEDPDEALKRAVEEAEKGGPPVGRYDTIYGGWTEVENAALALAETANLLLVPGRMCRNGKPAPTDQEDFQRFTQLLADAGMASYEAALTKDLDEMLIVGDTVTEACAACHEVYRDTDDEADRCTPTAAAAE